MSKFSELSDEQQKSLLDFIDLLFRGTEGDVNRSFAKVQHMLDCYAAYVSEALKTLDADTPLPTNTGLPGAQQKTPAQLISAMASYAAACSAFNTDEFRQSRIQSAGIAASGV